MGCLHQVTPWSLLVSHAANSRPWSDVEPAGGEPLPRRADVEVTDIQAAPSTTDILQGFSHPKPLPEQQQLETVEESLPKLTLFLKLL